MNSLVKNGNKIFNLLSLVYMIIYLFIVTLFVHKKFFVDENNKIEKTPRFLIRSVNNLSKSIETMEKDLVKLKFCKPLHKKKKSKTHEKDMHLTLEKNHAALDRYLKTIFSRQEKRYYSYLLCNNDKIRIVLYNDFINQYTCRSDQEFSDFERCLYNFAAKEFNPKKDWKILNHSLQSIIEHLSDTYKCNQSCHWFKQVEPFSITEQFNCINYLKLLLNYYSDHIHKMIESTYDIQYNTSFSKELIGSVNSFAIVLYKLTMQTVQDEFLYSILRESLVELVSLCNATYMDLCAHNITSLNNDHSRENCTDVSTKIDDARKSPYLSLIDMSR